LSSKFVFMSNRITELFNINYPVVQGGMVWCSGYKLAAAVSNSGGLGLIGAGSMYPEVLREHIRKAKAATPKPFGVNVPLIYPDIEDIMQIITDEKVGIVFTSAGNPKAYTAQLQAAGIKVAHVVANSKFAIKADEAGVDAIVAEGFEAGGHNGREETTTLTLIPAIQRTTNKPLVAAGGIASGRGMLAAMMLGADGVQVGTRFAASQESSAHMNFKKAITQVKEGDTKLLMRSLVPVRLIMNNFAKSILDAETKGESRETLNKMLGKGRAKKGMFEGDMNEGELEIGQIASEIDSILPADKIMQMIIGEYQSAINEINQAKYRF
jgi:enoyl-[acyl-carrier protein] reductase II